MESESMMTNVLLDALDVDRFETKTVTNLR